MAGYGVTMFSEAVQPMALEEGSGAVGCLKGNEFAVFVPDIKSTSGDPLDVEVLAAAMDKVRKLIVDKAKHSAEGSGMLISINEIPTSKVPVEAGKAAAAIDEIQTEKMDKLPVEAGKAVAAMDKIQTDKMNKAPLDGEKILAMPTELPYVIPYSRGNNIAELLGVTEEWLEEKRKLYREAAARSERISNEYLLFQEESESDEDDEYEYEPQQYSEELWKSKDRSGFQFFDPDAAEELCCVK